MPDMSACASPFWRADRAAGGPIRPPAPGWVPRIAGVRPELDFGPSPFARLALAHALAVAGDTLVTMALAGSLFFDISPNAARGRVALSLVLTMAPFAVVAPFLGPALDRVPRSRRLMVAGAGAARAVVCVGMARVLEGLLLVPLAFVTLVLSKTHAVTKSALVPGVVDSEEELVQANAKLALGAAAVGIVTALPGLVLLRLGGGQWVLGAAAVAFAAAAVAALRIRAPRFDDPDRREAGAAEIAASGIRQAAVAMGGLRAAVGFLTFLVAFALRREGEPAWVFGLVLVAGVVGTSGGAVLAPVARRRVREESLLVGAVATVGLGAVVAFQVGGRLGAVLLAAVVGTAAAAGRLAFDALVQRDAPDAVQGRQFARFEAAFQLAWVAGALAPVVAPVPPGGGFAALAVAGVVGALAYGVQRRRVPA
jgi:MFS family permease